MKSILHLSTRTSAISAVATLSAFPCLVIAANVIQRDSYSAAREAVSNLALGQAGWLMTLAFLSLGIGTLLMAVVVRRLTVRAILGPLALAAAGCTTLLSAVFQTDAENASSTLHGTIHIALGLGSFALVILATIACTIAFLRSGSRRGIGILSSAFATGAVGAMVTTFVLPDSLFGVGQRLFLGVAIGWMLTTCLYAIRISGVQHSDAQRSAMFSAAAPKA